MAKIQLKVFSVSQLSAMVAAAIEEMLPARLIVSGQIGDFKLHSSGHCYFSLKDQSGVLPCVMWAGKFRQVKFQPENGMAVLATGSVQVYIQGGKYQLYVEKLEPAGVGALQIAFEQLKAKLRAEGLFDEARKKPLPRYPMSIGIITSQSGAALQDIRDSIFGRWPCAKLYLFDVRVQGDGAAQEIASAIRRANNKKLAMELLIVGRGGGSMEDLWAFNEEVVARAIAASALPVISAVGHEVDFTIADFVADKRASTPTQAGMIAVPDMADLLKQLRSIAARLMHSAAGELRHCTVLLDAAMANAVFKTPQRLLFASGQMFDEVSSGLDEAIGGRLISADRRLRDSENWVRQIEPMRMIYAGSQKVQMVFDRLSKAAARRLAAGRQVLERFEAIIRQAAPAGVVRNHSTKLAECKNLFALTVRNALSKNRMQLTSAENRLNAMNPKAVLSRGYSITVNKRTGTILTSAGQVQKGDLISTELSGDEAVESIVEKTLIKEQKK